jgi:hypothetical protein
MVRVDFVGYTRNMLTILLIVVVVLLLTGGIGYRSRGRRRGI